MIKKNDLKKLALLGLTSGLIITTEEAAASLLDDTDAGYVLAAKHGCPGKNGCPGKTAARDLPAASKIKYQAPDAKDATDATDVKANDNADTDPNAGNLGYHLMTEDELLIELSDSGAKQFNDLSPEGKALALQVASMRCKGSNDCAGLNACKTDQNDCAGKGSCKGQGKCAIADKNLAVKLVYEKMSDKRTSALSK